MWALKTTTCLSLRLNPIDLNHQPIMCISCVLFWQKKPKFNLNKHSKAQRSQRMLCNQPIACGKNAKEGNLHARD